MEDSKNIDSKKSSFLNQAIKLSIILTTLAIGFSVTYYLVIFLPKKEKMTLEQKKQEQELQIKAKEEEEKIRKECYEKAIEEAEDLLKTKSEMYNDQEYKKAAEKDLYLKDDFSRSYENCLSLKGLKK